METHEGYGGTQFVYLSATVGNPEWLAEKLRATLIEYEERPVPIERHVTFADSREKAQIADKLVKREFDTKSSKGYRGQTIIFTNSRRRCHEISRKLRYDSAPYITPDSTTSAGRKSNGSSGTRTSRRSSPPRRWRWRRRRLPRLAGDLRLAGDGDRVALRSGVLLPRCSRAGGGLPPRPWPCLPPRRARRRLPQLHGPDRR